MPAKTRLPAVASAVVILMKAALAPAARIASAGAVFSTDWMSNAS